MMEPMEMNKTKKTVIIGATTNPARYAYVAAGMLTEYKHEIIPIGIKKGEVYGTSILDVYQRPPIGDVDTVTLYIGPQHQPEHYDYIMSLKPKRVIFNQAPRIQSLKKWLRNQEQKHWKHVPSYCFGLVNIDLVLRVVSNNAHTNHSPFAILFFKNAYLRSFIMINLIIYLLGVMYVGTIAINSYIMPFSVYCNFG